MRVLHLQGGTILLTMTMTAPQEVSRLHAENERLKAQLRAKTARIQILELELKRASSDRDILEDYLKNLNTDEVEEDKSKPGELKEVDNKDIFEVSSAEFLALSCVSYLQQGTVKSATQDQVSELYV